MSIKPEFLFIYLPACLPKYLSTLLTPNYLPIRLPTYLILYLPAYFASLILIKPIYVLLNKYLSLFTISPKYDHHRALCYRMCGVCFYLLTGVMFVAICSTERMCQCGTTYAIFLLLTTFRITYTRPSLT